MSEPTDPAAPHAATAAPDPAIAYLVYDGECPFCSQYVRLLRLRSRVGEIVLIDARQGGPLVNWLWAAGCRLDDEMAFIWRGQVYLGADAINRLALITGKAGLLGRINAMLLSSPRVARVAYPVLRAGRAMALALLGRERLRPIQAFEKTQD